MKVILLESDIKKIMIIECINCNKKFNVNSELIPTDGRQIQCGSCKYTWHYKIEEDYSKPIILNNIEKSEILIKDNYNETSDTRNLTDETPPTNLKKEVTNIKSNINNFESKFINNLFSYLIVFIISLVALLILVDTIKSPLINIFPNLEIVLFNLFETLKDVKFFIIDLT